MIGYRAVKVKQVSDKHGNSDLFAPKQVSLSGDALSLRQDLGDYEKVESFKLPL